MRSIGKLKGNIVRIAQASRECSGESVMTQSLAKLSLLAHTKFVVEINSDKIYTSNLNGFVIKYA